MYRTNMYVFHDLLSQGYLNSEVVLGKILAGRRKNVVIATKFGTRVPKYGPEDIEVSLTNSLQKLQTDYIDLYQVCRARCTVCSIVMV